MGFQLLQVLSMQPSKSASYCKAQMWAPFELIFQLDRKLSSVSELAKPLLNFSDTHGTQHPKGIAERITPHSITPKSTHHKNVFIFR